MRTSLPFQGFVAAAMVAASVFAQSSHPKLEDKPTCASYEHCYPIAKLTTISGQQVTLKNVAVFIDAERITHYGGMHQEVTFVTYRRRTSLGADFQGETQSFRLYVGKTPILFRKIVFAEGGAASLLQFENHPDLTAESVEFTFPQVQDDYGPDQWLFYGEPLDGGADGRVTIRGSKLKSIVLEGLPPQYSTDD